VWHRSFHPDVVVRLERYRDGARVVRHTLANDVVIDSARMFLPDRWKSLASFIRIDEVWRAASALPQCGPPTTIETEHGPKELTPCVIHLDGSGWLFEGVRDGQYHSVMRHGSEMRLPEGDSLRAIAFAFLLLGHADLRGSIY
jgi:hypothetical protein